MMLLEHSSKSHGSTLAKKLRVCLALLHQLLLLFSRIRSWENHLFQLHEIMIFFQLLAASNCVYQTILQQFSTQKRDKWALRL